MNDGDAFAWTNEVDERTGLTRNELFLYNTFGIIPDRLKYSVEFGEPEQLDIWKSTKEEETNG